MTLVWEYYLDSVGHFVRDFPKQSDFGFPGSQYYCENPVLISTPACEAARSRIRFGEPGVRIDSLAHGILRGA